MKEYEESAKSAKFIDRRLGEKDDTLQEFDKAILRLQRERQVTNRTEFLLFFVSTELLHFGFFFEEIENAFA